LSGDTARNGQQSVFAVDAIASMDALDYVPMPDKVVTEVEKVWASEIKDSSGRPLWTGATAH
jgi:hypothetical protein